MNNPSVWRVAIVGFSHMHAGDQLHLALENPLTELVGVWDQDARRALPVLADFGLSADLYFAELDDLISDAAPHIVVVCSTTGQHRPIVEALAPHGVHVMLEKPFAPTVEDADAMIDAMQSAGGSLCVNWPLAWYPSHRTTQRLIAEGHIGRVLEVHYYDGNRGPLKHAHDKKEVVGADKAESWWYSAQHGGGSLLDYLGYGATLSTWMRGGELPTAVLAKSFIPQGLEVDEQSVVIATFDTGLSVLQTRWGTFTDPWTVQPYPRCGFVVVGEHGTILSEDYATEVQVQTTAVPTPTAVPVDVLPGGESTGLGYLVDRLSRDLPIEGPSSWQLSRAGQLIVDAAARSAALGAEVTLETTRS